MAHNFPILFTKASRISVGPLPPGLIGKQLSGRLLSRAYGPAALFGSPDPADPTARAVVNVVRLDFPIEFHVVKSSRWGKRRTLQTVDRVILVDHEDRITPLRGDLPPIHDSDTPEYREEQRLASEAYWNSPAGQARENAPLYK